MERLGEEPAHSAIRAQCRQRQLEAPPPSKTAACVPASALQQPGMRMFEEFAPQQGSQTWLSPFPGNKWSAGGQKLSKTLCQHRSAVHFHIVSFPWARQFRSRYQSGAVSMKHDSDTVPSAGKELRFSLSQCAALPLQQLCSHSLRLVWGCPEGFSTWLPHTGC